MVIRLKGVKRVVSKGSVYYYHRKTMTRLPGELGTTAFMDALAAAERTATAVIAPMPGTLGALIAQYRRAPEFAALAERTKRDYQKVFDYLRALDAMPLHDIDRQFLYGVRDKAFGKRKRRFANCVIQVLSRLFNWGKRRDLAEDNPAADVESIRRPRDARQVNRPWKDEEIATVLAAAPPELRVAIALGAHLGFREADMLALTWSAYDGTAFEIRQGKTGEPLWVPAHKELRAILNEHKEQRRSPIIVVGAKGRPFTQTGFQTRFFGLLRALKRWARLGRVYPSMDCVTPWGASSPRRDAMRGQLRRSSGKRPRRWPSTTRGTLIGATWRRRRSPSWNETGAKNGKPGPVRAENRRRKIG